MSRKKPIENSGGSWLDTYADMVTLLLTFFAVLLSMSNTDEVKFNAFIRSIQGLPPMTTEDLERQGVETTEEGDIILTEDYLSSMEELFVRLASYVEENNMEESVAVSFADNVIQIDFDSSVLFEPDSYILRMGAREVLSFVGAGLKEYENYIKLVEATGHTADVNRENEMISDWMLSSQRAAVVVMHFQDVSGFDPYKLATGGAGKYKPIDDNDTEEGRANNRRVALSIIGIDAADSLSTDVPDLPPSGDKPLPPPPATEDPGEAPKAPESQPPEGAESGVDELPPTESEPTESSEPTVPPPTSPYE